MKIQKIILGAAAVLALVGCNSQKKMGRTTQETPVKEEQVVRQKTVQEKAVEAQPDFTTALAQKARFSITYQKKNISASGTISLIKDSICIVSVQPILNIELARLEITPEEVLFVDKMNKRYVRMSFAELSEEVGSEVRFEDVQNVLMARMTVLGQPQSVLWGSKAKSLYEEGIYKVLLSEGKISYEYRLQPTELTLQGAVLTMGKHSATITYAGHALHEGVLFPNMVSVKMNTSDIEAEGTITMPNLVFNGAVNASRLNIKNYKATNIATILK